MENNVVTVRIRNIYGRDLYYPVCDNAAAFASIAGTETLNLSVLEKIYKLGFLVMVEYAPGLLKSLTF
jgi:deoxyinosine 3'endonuclease (endonuclease V)